jgi:hypothetical protein
MTTLQRLMATLQRLALGWRCERASPQGEKSSSEEKPHRHPQREPVEVDD